MNNPIKGVVLHPQQRRRSLKDWQVKRIQHENLFSKKRFKKACENRKRMLHLHPAKRAKFLDKLIRKREEKEIKYFSKKLQNFLAS